MRNPKTHGMLLLVCTSGCPRPKETPASCHMVDLDDEKDLNDTSEKPHEYGRCSRSEFVA